MKKMKKPKKKKKGAVEEVPSESTGPIFRPIDEHVRDMIRTERFEER